MEEGIRVTGMNFPSSEFSVMSQMNLEGKNSDGLFKKFAFIERPSTPKFPQCHQVKYSSKPILNKSADIR